MRVLPAGAAPAVGPMTAPGIVGSWRKRAAPPCAARYPDVLEFLPGGQYRGYSDPAGEFTHWDVGTWEARGAGRIAVSTANDAVVTYRFELRAGRLSFTDPDGCEFSYEPDDQAGGGPPG
ncbi:MAG TPA: hypothetical protein VF535_00670 [Allosphingosinicella sp.]|jgi:hypothetical protein